MARIVFFCHDTRSHLDTVEYYKQDIDALKALGHELVVCTKYRELPFHFDALFVWWWTYALWPTLLCRCMRKPCIITGVYNFRFPLHLRGNDYFGRPYWQRFLIGTATRLCSLNLFIDEAEDRSCSEFFKLRTGRHYPCILSDDYLQGPADSREIALFNIAWGGKGNLIRKGIPDLLRAVRLLKDEGFAVRVYLAGNRGDGVGYVHSLIEDLRIEDEVVYLGPLARAEKIDLLRRYEIYVQPSLYEGFGLATAEAMGCGACVITCDVGAVRSVVGDCGIYVTPGSAEELAQAIKQAVLDPVLRHRLQRDAHQRARLVMTVETKLKRLQRYLSEVGLV